MEDTDKTDNFWELNFTEKQTMWGFEPADSAIMAKDLFLKNKIKNILIPGIGYGRNAKVFLDNGIHVTGIEISQTAINLAKSQNNLNIKIHHGSVTDMPFDEEHYDGIYCYALIHLLNRYERNKFIKDCYKQLSINGLMIFITISPNDPMYGKGRKIGKDRFERIKGAKLFFYKPDSIKQEFGKYGLVDFFEINEPIKFTSNHPPLKFTMIICRKQP